MRYIPRAIANAISKEAALQGYSDIERYPRTYDETRLTDHLYVFQEPELGLTKIGMSQSPLDRFIEIFKMSLSKKMVFYSVANVKANGTSYNGRVLRCVKAEQKVHCLFGEHRQPYPDERMPGKYEWFTIDPYDASLAICAIAEVIAVYPYCLTITDENGHITAEANYG